MFLKSSTDLADKSAKKRISAKNMCALDLINMLKGKRLLRKSVLSAGKITHPNLKPFLAAAKEWFEAPLV